MSERTPVKDFLERLGWKYDKDKKHWSKNSLNAEAEGKLLSELLKIIPKKVKQTTTIELVEGNLIVTIEDSGDVGAWMGKNKAKATVLSTIMEKKFVIYQFTQEGKYEVFPIDRRPAFTKRRRKRN